MELKLLEDLYVLYNTKGLDNNLQEQDPSIKGKAWDIVVSFDIWGCKKEDQVDNGTYGEVKDEHGRIVQFIHYLGPDQRCCQSTIYKGCSDNGKYRQGSDHGKLIGAYDPGRNDRNDGNDGLIAESIQGIPE